MDVFAFLDMCIDTSLLTVTIYDVAVGENVYSGSAEEIPEEFQTAEVCSWDVPTKVGEVTLNIDSEW